MTNIFYVYVSQERKWGTMCAVLFNFSSGANWFFFQKPDESTQSKNIDRRDKIFRQGIMKMWFLLKYPYSTDKFLMIYHVTICLMYGCCSEEYHKNIEKEGSPDFDCYNLLSYHEI